MKNILIKSAAGFIRSNLYDYILKCDANDICIF